MFPDQFLPNAAIGVLGFAAALFWLRSGMVRRGVLALVLLAVATDIALVARFVYTERGSWYFTGLWSMQAAALGTTAWLLLALGRRHWSADARRRDDLFAAGFQHYLRDEFSPARDLFLRVLRANPWDVAATVALANVAWRQGRLGSARGLLHAARRLDREHAYGDFISQQMHRVGTDRGRQVPPKSK